MWEKPIILDDDGQQRELTIQDALDFRYQRFVVSGVNEYNVLYEDQTQLYLLDSELEEGELKIVLPETDNLYNGLMYFFKVLRYQSSITITSTDAKICTDTNYDTNKINLWHNNESIVLIFNDSLKHWEVYSFYTPVPSHVQVKVSDGTVDTNVIGHDFLRGRLVKMVVLNDVVRTSGFTKEVFNNYIEFTDETTMNGGDNIVFFTEKSII